MYSVVMLLQRKTKREREGATMIIAAIRNDNEYEDALNGKASLIFDLNSSILTLEEKVKQVHGKGKKLFGKK